MSRKDQYNKKVRGKIGGLDLVGVNKEVDFVINKAGAKVYKDLSKHNMLEIPSINNETDKGRIYEVLSVGLMPPGTPIATVKMGDLAVAFLLPTQLTDWVQQSMGLAMQGVKVFPTEVEFGFFNERYYTEII